MRVVMIAPPTVDTGTEGALIAAHFDTPHIATGELVSSYDGTNGIQPRDDLAGTLLQEAERLNG